MKRICVYCGSSPGAKPEYAAAAAELGTLLAARGIELVYGGGRVGIMGAVAKAALAKGGTVIGVIPQEMMGRQLGLREATRLEIVPDMHARKARMAELADAFVALPGGYGTMEELFEALTWLQLGYHAKPCALLNTLGYYDGLLEFLDCCAKEEFMSRHCRDLLLRCDSPAQTLEKLTNARITPHDKARWALKASNLE